MMNRQQLTENTIQFEDFPQGGTFVGQELELPMNAWGSVVARFKVTSVRAEGLMLIAQAVKVSE